MLETVSTFQLVFSLAIGVFILVSIYLIASRLKAISEEMEKNRILMHSLLVHNYSEYSQRVCKECGAINFYNHLMNNATSAIKQEIC